jgi:hypothetical protein
VDTVKQPMGQRGRKGRLERGSKMFGTINHLARHGVEERLEGGVGYCRLLVVKTTVQYIYIIFINVKVIQ